MTICGEEVADDQDGAMMLLMMINLCPSGFIC